MSELIADSPLHSWKQSLLSKRDLQRPDGRSLYRYRLSDDEFNELEALLKKQLYNFSPQAEFGAKATRLPGFPTLFVLYAAEWWRRRYNGAHWSWDPILRDIGVNPDAWNQAQRGDCVRSGLQDWGLKLRDSGGLRFLGSVAVEGGLPLRLLSEARGSIGQMLSRVLQLAGGRSVTQPELLAWVESLQGTLPKSYRQGAIFTLLADVVWTVLCLKDEAGLTSSIDAIETLDQKIGGWRERFPLPLEDGQAKGLIEQLVKDVANVRTERQTVCLPVERSLECSNGTWALRSTLVLPDTIQAKQLAALFAEPNEKHLPHMGELTLHVNATPQRTTLRLMAGHDASYRLERKSWGHEKQAAANEHVLKLSAQDGRVWTATAPKGELLDEDLPWIFSTEDANYRLLRQGGGNVAESEVLVAASETWTVRHEVESSADLHGTISGSARCVYRVRGKVIFFDESGQSHKVKTAQAETENENHEWRGDRLWLDFQNPAMTFKGAPHCYRITADGVAHREPGAPGLSLIGASASSAHLHGPVSLRYPATGEIKYRSRVVLLPQSAMLAMNCKDAQSGELRLENWAANGVRVLTDGIIGNIRVENTTLILLLSLKPGTQAPENVELEIFWLGNPRPARLTLPFPARGARAFDASGRELPTGSLLAVQQLLGMRL